MSEIRNLARVGDISIGVCIIPDCCDGWVGFFVTGSSNVFTNGRQQVRVGDIGVNTSCCHIHFAATYSSTVDANNRGVHRINDIVIGPCCIGITVTGSETVLGS